MPAFAFEDKDLNGVWQYDGFFYEGHRYPNPNPNLELYFTFNSVSHVDVLYYSRKNEVGFCERRAEFSVKGNSLHQQITWINPANNAECQQDVDMQIRRASETPFSFNVGELWFHLEVNGKPFTYILKEKNGRQAHTQAVDGIL